MKLVDLPKDQWLGQSVRFTADMTIFLYTYEDNVGFITSVDPSNYSVKVKWFGAEHEMYYSSLVHSLETADEI